MSRRFLITLWPFTGHLLPQLSIANALRERGHEVAFYTGEDARGTIDQEGFELFPFERIDEERVFRSMRAVETGDQRARPGGGRLLRILRDWLDDPRPGRRPARRASAVLDVMGTGAYHPAVRARSTTPGGEP